MGNATASAETGFTDETAACSVADRRRFATLAAISAVARHRFRQFDRGEWLKPFLPLLRLELPIVYALAGWHKLNAGFFDPRNSCAVLTYQSPGILLSGDFGLNLAHYQRDPVRILRTNDEVLHSEARSGVDMPLYVVQKRIADLARAGVKGIAVTCVGGGKTITLTQEKAEMVPELATMPSWLERKTLRFRTTDLGGAHQVQL